MRVLPMKVPKLTYYNNLWSFSCGHDLRYVSYSSNVGATYKHLKICYNCVQDKSLFFSSAWKRKKRNRRLSKVSCNYVQDNFRIPRYYIKHGWTSPQWRPWGQKKVAIMIDDWIFYQILSTNSLRKCMEISLENFYVDIGAERWDNLSVILHELMMYLFAIVWCN